MRTAAGIARRRTELSAGEAVKTKAQCQKKCDELNAWYESRATGTRTMTFAEAWSNYVDSGKPVPKMSKKLLERFGEMDVREITDSEMLAAGKAIFKSPSPQQMNRHLYTPVIAILRMASKSKVCDPPNLTRPHGHLDLKEARTAPPDDWYPKLLPLLPPRVQALIVFTTIHGRRLGEALKLRWADVDLAKSTAELGKTKNGEPVMIDLHPLVCQLLVDLRKVATTPEVFGYRPTSYGGDAVRKLIRETCERNGLDYYQPHRAGRHAFARRMLGKGFSLEHTRQAGGWKSLSVLSKHYGHLARSETQAAVLTSSEQLVDLIGSGGQVGEANLPPEPETE